MAIGWMLEVVERKTGENALVEGDDEVIVIGGRTLAKAIPRAQIERFKVPSPEEIDGFNHRVARFCSGLGINHEPEPRGQYPLDIQRPELGEMIDAYTDEGNDIGVGPFKDFSPTKFRSYLGYPPGGRPPPFRKWTAAELDLIPPNAKHDEHFEGATEVQPAWHWLV
ncbi:hypothetical protein V5O48_006032 [Marasmius crinis-equi]|uniref:Uncharacterized protein n=1 Tax=Marasmius crinis-equi TaxID=585013 RepID=A0ABR3FKU7_9AGAR